MRQLMKKTLGGIALSLVLAGGLAACGGVDEEGTVDQLVELGIPEDAARCVVDTALEEIPDDVLIGEAEATPEQDARIIEIFTECNAFPAG
jgi:hypothetical protein